MRQSRFKKILVHLFFIGQEPARTAASWQKRTRLQWQKSAIGKPDQKSRRR
jgi:hypothetical protein